MRLGDGDKTIAYVETKPSALDTSRLREKSSGKLPVSILSQKLLMPIRCCSYPKYLFIYGLFRAKSHCLSSSQIWLRKEHHGQ